MKLVILTSIPSPYQVELFDEIQTNSCVELSSVYVEWSSGNRNWARRKLNHHAVALSDGRSARDDAESLVEAADLFVCSWYSDSDSRSLMRLRLNSKAPMCLWGEPPRLSIPLISKWRRRLLLRGIYSSTVPIWGIGESAVKAWRCEFGESRQYFNVPYASDLQRFSNAAATRVYDAAERRFLYSGSLIHRKGVDLLASAFLDLAHENPAVSLTIVGVGNLENRLRAILEPVRSRVKFLGFQDWDRLPEIYAQCDFLVAPSRYDGWGLIVPEGLAAGLPVISTERTGAAIELIEKEKNGWRINAGSSGALLSVMRKASQLPLSHVQDMSRMAFETAAQFSLQDGAQRFIHAAHCTIKGQS